MRTYVPCKTTPWPAACITPWYLSGRKSSWLLVVAHPFDSCVVLLRIMRASRAPHGTSTCRRSAPKQATAYDTPTDRSIAETCEERPWFVVCGDNPRSISVCDGCTTVTLFDQLALSRARRSQKQSQACIARPLDQRARGTAGRAPVLAPSAILLGDHDRAGRAHQTGLDLARRTGPCYCTSTDEGRPPLNAGER